MKLFIIQLMFWSAIVGTLGCVFILVDYAAGGLQEKWVKSGPPMSWVTTMFMGAAMTMHVGSALLHRAWYGSWKIRNSPPSSSSSHAA